MTNQINKIFTIFSYLLLSLFISSCTEGDRGFVPIADDPVEEVEADIIITGGAVKGPLVNAEINIYKFELDKGPINSFNKALNSWFDLLDENEVDIAWFDLPGDISDEEKIEVIGDALTVVGVSAEVVVKNIQKSVDGFGYVTELKALKSELDNVTDFNAANLSIDSYLDKETNSGVRNEVQKIKIASATLSQLKKEINDLETLTDELLALNSFSAASNLFNKYSSQESDSTKKDGFLAVQTKITKLATQSSKFSLFSIRNYYLENIYDVFLNDFSLQNDLSARQNIIDLKSKLDSASSVIEAEDFIKNAHRKEGNLLVKASLAQLIGNITIISDLHDLIIGHEAFYHDFALRTAIIDVLKDQTPITESAYILLLDAIYKSVTATFTANLEVALRDSLIIEEEDAVQPLNLLSFGLSNDQGLLPSLNVGQYRGFVYMETKATSGTIDLNTGSKPIIEKMETIFHTDDILGNGDNTLEDETVYFLLNGDVQRDSDGNLIIDQSLINSLLSDKLLEIRPSFFATPLTDFAFGLAIDKLKNISSLKGDIDQDLLPDHEITEAVLKGALKSSAEITAETFGIGLSDYNLFKSLPVRLPQMQYLPESELEAIQYRLSVENYASFLYDLMNLTNLKGAELIDLLIQDLNDGQIDGLDGKEKIQGLLSVPYLDFLLKIDPSERLIPNTTVPVSNIYFLMNQEHSSILPSEPLSFFQTRNVDIAIQPPKGGTDLDSDGVLDNDDQFPQDPLKSRNLNLGYPGIWSVNYDSSETEYMPFNDPFVFQLNKEQIEGLCTLEPCLGLGDTATPISFDFTLIDAPANQDFTRSLINDNSSIGFSAFATTPGDYLVKAVISTDIEPVQTYTFYIPINVVDPKSIEIKFDPAVDLQPGKPVITSFKVTKAICNLYTICEDLDLNDGEDHFLPLSLLNDIFSVNQQVKRKDNTLSYSSVTFKNLDQTAPELSNIGLSNIELNDTVSISVTFNAGERSLVAASYNKIIGDSEDADGDGVSDLNDFYPSDSACYLEKDGIHDTNFDGVVNELDSPICFETKISQPIQKPNPPSTETLEVSFLNETWFYNPDWHFIIRANKYSSGYNGYIKTPTLQGTKEAIQSESFLVDPVTKRIYFAYKNGAIDYYSLELQSIQEFAESYDFSPVKTMHLLGTYLLVEYDSDEDTKLFNSNSNLAVIGSDANYPYPGNAITLNVDDQNLISATNNLLGIDWVLERESAELDDANQNYLIDEIQVLTTNDGLTLNSGQTVFGDVIRVTLNYLTEDDRTISLDRNVFVLGAKVITFASKSFDDGDALTFTLTEFNSELLSKDNKSLFVKWYKFNTLNQSYDFSLSDVNYPFVFEGKNTKKEDIVRGDLYIQHGSNAIKIASLEAVILGDLQQYIPTLDESIIDNISRTVNITLLEPSPSVKYFNKDTFTPVWKINNNIVQNENESYFPSLASTTFRYGDNISVSYEYRINGLSGETRNLVVGLIQLISSESIFSVDSQTAEIGDDISLNINEFTNTELAVLEARWRINGVVAKDKDQPKDIVTDEYKDFNLFTYPGSKLSYGDSVELLLLPENATIDNAFAHIAVASVGVNLESLSNNQSDPENDLDSDNDGIPNHLDYFRYDDQCSLPSEGMPDDIDLDGINDLDELKNIPKTNPNLSDTDGDGLSDYAEINVHSTDPLLKDSDGDGYLDGVEIDLGTDANIANSSLYDNDFDGLSNDLELSNNTKVNVFDTDNDGLSDWFELNIKERDPFKLKENTNPLLADSDGDMLSDGVEIKVTFTDPNVADTDGDGINDGIEVVLKLDPNSQDTDADGVLDADESGLDFNVTIPSVLFQNDLINYKILFTDSDGDKLSDVVELRVTFTNPKVADTDSDGINDGVEVVLNLDPKSDDTNDDGILDADESGYDFNVAIPFGLLQDDLKNYNSNFSSLLNVEQGTCFKTWLANNKPAFVINTHNSQLDSNSTQEVAFASDDWNQIIRFDATNTAFTDLIELNIYDAKVTSINYDAVNSEILYVGFSDGWIRQYNAQTEVITDVFNTDRNMSITTIVAHDEFLIAEQIDEDNQIHHSVFNLTTPFDENPTSTLISDYSYLNSIWLDDSALSRLELISFDENFSSSSFIKETINPALANPIVSSGVIELSTPLESPLFIEQLNAKDILNFANGRSYNLSDNLLLTNTITPFDLGFEHQNHRIISQPNASFLEMTTFNQSDAGKYWNFNSQLTNKELLTVLPVGHHLLAISFTEPSKSFLKDGKIAFQHIVLGDEDGDSLPDWWNNLSESLTVEEFDNYQLTDDAIIPDLLDGTPNIDDSLTAPVLVDTDGDGICDHWEITLFGTDPLLQDTDNDKMSDDRELGIVIESTLNCIDYPTFTVISDPLNPDSDADGLEDGDEEYFYFTKILNPDSDGDGLTDYQEIFITNTDPNNDQDNGDGDSDGDNLSDSDELNLYNTDFENRDSDSDELDDDKEVLVHNTNPNNNDSDGDGLLDKPEVTEYFTDPSSIDSDTDGISDVDELNLTNELEFKSDPNVVDTDGDGLSDFIEFEFFYPYSGELLVILDNPKLKPNPDDIDTDKDGICDKWEVLNFLTNPAEADTDGDGLTDAQELGINLGASDICLTQPESLPISSSTTRDTDLDRILDGDEVLILFTNPKDKDSDDNNINDDLEDPDQDGLNNYQELYQTLTDPLNPDSDGNGINDGDDDIDGDGLSNKDEINIYGTYPLNADSDGDGINDKEEIDNNLNPTSLDTDGDSLSDSDEINIYHTDPNHPDTDRDGSTDDEEINIKKSDPNNPDTDNDFLLDGDDDKSLNPDADADGIPDGIEVNYLGTNPDSSDSDQDGLSDGYEAWVFAFNYDSNTNLEQTTLIKTGEDLLQVLNSHANTAGWLEPPVKFIQNNLDRVVVDLVDVLDPSLIKGRLYIHRYSNPTTSDSDGDGLFDSTEFDIERAYGVDYSENFETTSFNPLALNSVNFKISNPWSVDSNSGKDTDGDGIADFHEIKLTKTDPLDSDTDNNDIIDSLDNEDFDLLNNIEEVRFGSNSLVYEGLLDSDNDGLIDVFEKQLFSNTGSIYDPFNADSNGNGIADGDEDIDQDLLTNLEEVKFKTDPLTKDFGLDSDSDGLSDYQEQFATFTNRFVANSDGVGVLDGEEDFDGDGLSNIAELRLGSNPYVSNTETDIADTDNDGLTDFQEITFTKTDPNESNTDSDTNNIFDAAEDLDSDGLTNFQEMKLGTNPLVKDSYQLKRDRDEDGLVDIYEIKLTSSNPENPDTDGIKDNGKSDLLNNKDGDLYTDFQEVLLGTDPLVANVISFFNLPFKDGDQDGLSDFQEIYLTLTNPAKLDTDNNGINDGEEDSDGDGVSNLSEVLIQSDPQTGDTALDTDGDGLSDFIELKLTLTNPFEEDSNSNGITDANEDADLDGLRNYLELMLGTDPLIKNISLDADGDLLTDIQEEFITLTDPSLIDSDFNDIPDSAEDFDLDTLTNLQEITLANDPYLKDILDGDEDVDNDFYTNLKEQVNGIKSFTITDFDNDSLPDGLEALLLNTDISSADSDGDGLDDQAELKLLNQADVKSWLVREIQSNEFCSDLELRLSAIAGKDYCFTIEYLSYPTLVDSDNDGVADRSVNVSDNSIILDHYPLDSSCFLATDGFTKSDDNVQCFSSWMGEDESIDLIKQAEWIDTSNTQPINHADIMFFNTSWDSIVVYNALTETYGARISIKEEINTDPVSLIDFEFSKTDKLVYLLYSDSTIEVFNIQTGLVQTLVDQVIVGAPSSLKILNANRLILETRSAPNSSNLYLLDNAGNKLSDLLDQAIDIKDSVTVCANTDCNEDVSLYGFIKNSTGANTDLGRLDIDLLADLIVTSVSVANIPASDVIKGPIKLSQDSMFIQLGSGQVFSLLLEDTGTDLSRSHKSKTYDSYFDFVEYADHFVGIVDVDLTNIPGGEDVPNTQNGLIVIELESIKDTLKVKLDVDESINDLKELNQYLLPPQRLEEQVLKLIPFVSGVPLDTDGDGLTDYQETNLSMTNPLLKDTDGNGTEDAQEDFDGDSVSNLIEVSLGSDPLVSDVPFDTDGDGLTDYQEINLTKTNRLLKDTDGNGTEDAQEDFDGDSVSNLIEVYRGSDPFAPAFEMALIKKSNDRIVIDQLGLLDGDADLMTGLFEKVFGLDDNNVNDKFLDLDKDGLSNVEEYFFATDPSKEDSDADGWFDIDEIINGTDPNNNLSF